MDQTAEDVEAFDPGRQPAAGSLVATGAGTGIWRRPFHDRCWSEH
jgi:hypothetical protein